MYMVGIDVAKKTVVMAVLDGGNYSVVVRPTTVANEAKELKKYLLGIAKNPVIHSGSDTRAGDLAVCCESTSYYHHEVVRVCADLEIDCLVLNPIVTRQAIKATIRGRKTDNGDAVIIAKLGLRGEGALTHSVDNQPKVILRASNKLKSTAHALRLLRGSMQDRHIALPKPLDKKYDKCIVLLNELVDEYRQLVIDETSQKELKLLSSITGIGETIAAVLVAEIGDISRFKSAGKLIAYAGLDPRVRQSGSSLHRNTKLTKRGSTSLRRSVFLAANVARQYDPEIRAYYKKKRDEGRTYTEAMMPVARKLLNRIYAVWKNKRPYQKRT